MLKNSLIAGALALAMAAGTTNACANFEGVYISSDGRRIATREDDRRIVWWNTETGVKTTIKPKGVAWATSAAFDPTRKIIAVANQIPMDTRERWYVDVYRERDMTLLSRTRIDGDRQIYGVAIDIAADGTQLNAFVTRYGSTGSNQPLVTLVGKKFDQIGARIGVKGLGSTGNDRRITNLSSNTALITQTERKRPAEVIDTQSGLVISKIKLGCVAANTAASRESGLIATQCYDSSLLRIFSIASMSVLSEFEVAPDVWGLALSPNGSSVLVNHRTRAEIRNVLTGELEVTIDTAAAGIDAYADVAFSPDGRFIAMSGCRRTVEIPKCRDTIGLFEPSGAFIRWLD
jgi:WD40 repeat protein